MCSIALEKSCRVALNVIGNIAHSTCYHSFFIRFTNFNIYFCNLIMFLQILITIFVKEIRK